MRAQAQRALTRPSPAASGSPCRALKEIRVWPPQLAATRDSARVTPEQTRSPETAGDNNNNSLLVLSPEAERIRKPLRWHQTTRSLPLTEATGERRRYWRTRAREGDRGGDRNGRQHNSAGNRLAAMCARTSSRFSAGVVADMCATPRNTRVSLAVTSAVSCFTRALPSRREGSRWWRVARRSRSCSRPWPTCGVATRSCRRGESTRPPV